MLPGTNAAPSRRPPPADGSAARDDVLVGSRLGAPATCGRLIARPALVRRLVEARDAALALVVAPPGYGKTTLLSQWAQSDERAFISLAFSGRGVDDLGQAPTHGLDAFMQSGRFDLRSVPGPMDCTMGGPLDRLVVLMRALRAENRSFVLLLDDADDVAPAVLHGLVGIVLRELPRQSIVAVASRSEPAVPCGRLRAYGRLVEIRTHELAMTPVEADALLRRAGLEIDLGAVKALVRRTEGWPAALYLAAIALREQEDVATALTGFRGDDHRFAEYVREEVLAVLPVDLLDFAVRSSVLDELSGPVCNAVLGQSGSALTLTELGRVTPLLRPVDTAHERYRWHRLVRDLLSAELRRTGPELAHSLHHRASAWYQEQGDLDRTIEHAAAEHDLVRTGDLLWANITEYVTRGRNEVVRRWLSCFNHDELARYAPLALSAAHCFLAAGNADEAHHWAVAAAAGLERRRPAAAIPSLDVGLAGLEAMIGRTGASGMAETAAHACALESRDGPWRSMCLFLRGTALHLAGDREAAKPLLQESVDLSAAAQPSVTTLGIAQRAMIALEEQDWELAAELTARAVAIIAQHELEADPITALALAASAASQAHQGRADEAKRSLRSSMDLLAARGDSIPWYGAETRLLLAHASLWLADVIGARTLLAQASRLARRMPDAVIFERWFADAWSYMDTVAETSLIGPSSLTIAELRVLRFLPSHRSLREIAAQLGVSTNTVKTQAHAVYRKLGAASRSEAVARASEAGLLGQ